MDAQIQRRAWAYLSRVASAPTNALHRLVGEHGPVGAERLIRSRSVPPEVRSATEARHHLDLAAADLAAAHQRGGRLVTPDDPEWPAWPLLPFGAGTPAPPRVSGKDPVAPLALWVRGDADLAEVTERAVAIVGTRDVSGYGERVTTELCNDLVTDGFAVVSGGAYGVDGAAHRAVLSTHGRTIAVLACGLDVDYPVGHAALLERIAATGLVVTEYPPGTTAARYRFLARNRLIAGLAQGSVVVEAGWRSGARSTASWTKALGRPVMAVPGPVTSLGSTGCHQLIQAGEAYLVTSAADVRELAGRIGELAEEPGGGEQRSAADPVSVLARMAPAVAAVYEALPARGTVTPPQLSEGSGVALSTVRSAVTQLELVGLAERTERGWARSRWARGGA